MNALGGPIEVQFVGNGQKIPKKARVNVHVGSLMG
jgi:hypothetical protein